VYNRYVLPTQFHETLLDIIAIQKSRYAEKVGCTALKLVVTTHEYRMFAREVKIFETDMALCSKKLKRSPCYMIANGCGILFRYYLLYKRRSFL